MPNPTINCVYASTSGNVEFVVEAAAKILNAQGLPTQLHRSEQTPIEFIRDNQQFIFATSTWDHGILNPFFHPLFAAMGQTDFAGKKAGFIGLGDVRYEPVFFNRGIQLIHDLWKANQGEVLFRMLKINGDPYGQLDNLVTPWATEIASYFRGEKTGSAEHQEGTSG